MGEAVREVRLDLTNIMDLVTFFRKLLDERARLEVEGVLGTASHDSCSDDSGGFNQNLI